MFKKFDSDFFNRIKTSINNLFAKKTGRKNPTSRLQNNNNNISENHTDYVEESDNGAKKKLILGFAIIFSLFLFIGIGSIPISYFKKITEEKFRLSGFDASASGAKLNLFGMNYEVYNLSAKKSISKSANECSTGIQLFAPIVRVSFFGDVKVSDARLIVSTNNNTAELYDFFKQNAKLNKQKISVVNSSIAVSLCNGFDGVVVPGKIDDNSELMDDKKYIFDLLETPNFEMDFRKGNNHLNGKFLIGNEEFNLKFNNDKSYFDFNIRSNYLTSFISFKKDFDSDIGTKIGNFKFTSPDLSKLISILKGGGDDFLIDIFNSISILSEGDIFFGKSSIEASGKIDTAYGSGKVKLISGIANFYPKMTINFDQISVGKYNHIKSSIGIPQSVSIWDLLIKTTINTDHLFSLNLKKITGSDLLIEDIKLAYEAKNGGLKFDQLGFVINGDSIGLPDKAGPRESISDLKDASYDTITKKNNIASVRILMSGKNIYNVFTLFEKFFLSGKQVFLDNGPLQNIIYNGFADLYVDPMGLGGIGNFSIKMNNGGAISGKVLKKNLESGLISSLISNNSSISISNLNLNHFIDKQCMKDFFFWLAFARGLDKEYSDPKRFNLMKSLIELINDGFIKKSDIEFNDVLFDDEKISGSMSFSKNPTYINSSLALKSSFFKGVFNTSFATNLTTPKVTLNVKSDLINVDKLDSIVAKLYELNLNKSSSDSDQIIDISSADNPLKKKISIPNTSGIQGDINIESERVIMLDRNLNRVNLYAKLNGHILTLNKMYFDLDKLGSVTINGSANISSIPSFDSSIRVSEIKLENIADYVVGSKNSINGTASIDGNMLANGDSLYDIFLSSSGKLVANIYGLSFYNFDLPALTKELTTSTNYGKIDIIKVLFNGKKSSYKDISGELMLSNGKIYTDGMQIKNIGVSGLIKFSISPFQQNLNYLSSDFLILGRDPRPEKKFLSIPISLRSSGEFGSIKSQLYVDRVQEYIKSMYNLQLKAEAQQ